FTNETRPSRTTLWSSAINRRMGFFFALLRFFLSSNVFMLVLTVRRGNSYDCRSRTRFTCYRKCGANLLGSLLHADQPDTISGRAIADESFAVIAKLQADGVGIE